MVVSIFGSERPHVAGEDGLIERRRGRVSARAADEAEAAWVAEMFRIHCQA